MARTTYLIALGSNRRHVRYGAPAAVLRAAVTAMADEGLKILRVSRFYGTPALGPAGRDFVNGAALVKCGLQPPELLKLLKRLERAFGRRPARRWGPRVLDLDVILWSKGAWPGRLRWRAARHLAIPHRAMAARAFVLKPARDVAPRWRNPIDGRSVRQLAARLQSRH